MEMRKNKPKYVLQKANNGTAKLNPFPLITMDKLDDGVMLTNDNSEIKVPGYTIEELVEEIELLKRSSGCGSSYEFKQKIANKEIKNFSHVQIKIWGELEKNLQELEEND